MRTREMKHLLIALCISLSAGAVQAREPGAPSSVPPGNTMGVAIGANPPPGFYLSSRSGYWDAELKDSNGDFGGQTNTLADTAVQLMWVPGIKVLGGDYKALVTVPFLYNDQKRTSPFPPPLQGSANDFAMGNIEITPVSLSWQIEPGIFVSSGLSVYAPTGKFSPTAAINSGADFWTISPSVGFSYLRGGLNLSLNVAYFANTENTTTKYRSGDEILANFTAMKDFGGWSLGPVGYYRKQITDDKNNGANYGGTIQGKAEQAALGLGFSTRIGKVDASFNLTRDVYVRNTVGGTKLWMNFTVPLGGKS
jgi:hypothetical protein